MWGGIRPPTEGLVRTNEVEKVCLGSICLSWNIHFSPALGHRHSRSLGLWTHSETSDSVPPLHAFEPLAFLVLQFAHSRSWDFSACVILWTHSYNKSLWCICVYILLVLFLWGTLTSTRILWTLNKYYMKITDTLKEPNTCWLLFYEAFSIRSHIDGALLWWLTNPKCSTNIIYLW